MPHAAVPDEKHSKPAPHIAVTDCTLLHMHRETVPSFTNRVVWTCRGTTGLWCLCQQGLLRSLGATGVALNTPAICITQIHTYSNILDVFCLDVRPQAHATLKQGMHMIAWCMPGLHFYSTIASQFNHHPPQVTADRQLLCIIAL